jgi:hypothetical protein
MPGDKQSELVDTIFTEFQAQPAKAPGTDEKDPGIGWIAVINADRFAPFMEQIGGKTGPLWRMYEQCFPVSKTRRARDTANL